MTFSQPAGAVKCLLALLAAASITLEIRVEEGMASKWTHLSVRCENHGVDVRLHKLPAQ